MQQLTGHTTTTTKATRRDEETKTTRTRRIEREAEYSPRDRSEQRTKHTTREKRGPDGRLEAVKSRTRHSPNRIDEFEDDENYIRKHRDELL